MNKWYDIKSSAKGTAQITIFGDIGFGYNFADFDRDVKALGVLKEIELRINSYGGDVFQGFAMYDMIRRMKAHVRIVIEGVAASMASVIAMAGDEIVMPENSYLMIHNPIGQFEGGAEQFKAFADTLGELEEKIVQAYVERSGQDEKKVRTLMAKETWLSAKKAVMMGFADEVEKPVKIAALATDALGRFRNVPKGFGTTPNKEDHSMADKREDTIKRICALAGKSALADKFITDETSVEDVMKALETAKVTDDATVKAAADAVAEAKAKADAKDKDGKVDEAAIRKQVQDEHAEITALCDLAGMPDKANGFIVGRKSVSEVRAALVEAKKAEGEGDGKDKTKQRNDEINARRNHRPEGAKGQSLDTVKVWDKFNKVGAAAK